MKLIFRGHDDRYAVEQSLLAFFPEERPVYEPAEEGEDHALVTLSRSPRFNTAVTTITYHGRTARGISRTAVDPQLTEYEAERLRQKAVKLSFFKAAREITGITPSWGALTGIRPGKPTADYLSRISNRITLFGAIFLALIATIPSAILALTGNSAPFTATGILIVVSVAMETTQQLEAQMMMRHYKGFMK